MQKNDAPNAAARKAGMLRWIQNQLRPEVIERRFWSFVDKKGPDECWEWQGNLSKYRGHIPKSGHVPRGGPGSFSIGAKAIVASRFSWELAHGPVPDGLKVLHKCDNPPCVNPAHLFLGTLSDNTMDSIVKGRYAVLNGEKSGMHVLNEQSVREIRRDYIPRVVSLNKLASKYGVSKRTILFVLQRYTWKHIA